MHPEAILGTAILLAAWTWAWVRRGQRPDAGRTLALGLDYLTLHGGFIPEPKDPDRKPFLDTLGRAAALAHRALRSARAALGRAAQDADALRCRA